MQKRKGKAIVPKNNGRSRLLRFEGRVNGGLRLTPFARNMHVKQKESEITIEFSISYLAFRVPRTEATK